MLFLTFFFFSFKREPNVMRALQKSVGLESIKKNTAAKLLQTRSIMHTRCMRNDAVERMRRATGLGNGWFRVNVHRMSDRVNVNWKAHHVPDLRNARQPCMREKKRRAHQTNKTKQVWSRLPRSSDVGRQNLAPTRSTREPF